MLGRTSYYILFIAGLLSSTAFAPLFWWPVLLVSFSCLLFYLARAISWKQAFWQGWWFGFGHFSSGLYWVSIALFTDIEKFWWLLPFSIFGLPTILAIYIGIATMFTHQLPGKSWGKYILFASCWVVMEYLRARLFSGFPWNLIGYVWVGADSTMQLASIVGIYGLSFVTILFSACLYPYFISKKRTNLFYGLATGVMMVSLLYGFGYHRLQNASNDVTNIKLRLVQANIAQNHKWEHKLVYNNLMTHIGLSKAVPGSIDYVIWPESAVPFAIYQRDDILYEISKAVPEGGLLLTGSVRSEHRILPHKYWNTTSVIDDQGRIVNFYDKAHLLPFGEYIPFRFLLPKVIQKIAYGEAEFSQGQDNVVLLLDNKLPAVAPLICYEAIFDGRLQNLMNMSEKGKKLGTAKPGWILNTTNDGWFGNSYGPYQHLNMTRLRAVEFGIPLVRSAGTGISAIVDSYGRITASLPLGYRGVLDGVLPKSLDSSTFYSRYNEWSIVLIMVISMLTAYYLEKSRGIN